MHSIKGGWVGQTFALAKRNESDGRKSRIRRSKEERKAMVETFIKKYQESNNGNFPSLNLTHKEVGGSFYTVREIVRDIIQENRVLGPAKITLQELSSDQFFYHNPLGSIARDPQSFLTAASNENHPKPNNLLDTNGKKLSVSDGYYIGAEHQRIDKGNIIDKESVEATGISNGYYDGAEHVVVNKDHVIIGGQVDVRNKEFSEAIVVSELLYTGAEHRILDKGLVINGSQVDVINKESSDATTNPEMQVSKPMAPIQNEQELSTAAQMAKITPVTEDSIVETFSLSPVASTTDRTETLGELRGPSDSPENDIKMVEMVKSQERSELNGVKLARTSNLLDEKFQDGVGNQILQNKAGLDEAKSLGDTLAESAKDHEFEDSTEPQVRLSHQNTITLEAINQSKMIDGANTGIEDNFQAKNKTNPSTEGSKAYDEGGLQHKANNKHRVDGKIGGNSQRRSSTTLDRINLESWDGTPKNSAKQETNPLLSIFKAVVVALVKFWSK